MKRLIVLALVILMIMVANLLTVRKHNENTTKLNEAIASITPSEVKNGVVLSCKVVAVKQRSDYPEVLVGKSVPQIKQLILAEPPSC
ncbi:MAG TPA: hypothetical protein VLE73_00660 [Candidatus Saccharimonadales bacterium]|nr:hypothetical protein [Candidatus Saccharimonadales bacterium]